MPYAIRSILRFHDLFGFDGDGKIKTVEEAQRTYDHDGDDDGSRSDEGGEGEDKKCMVCGDHNSVEGNELIYCDGKDGECRHACHVLCCNPALKAPPARHVKWYCAPCDKRDVAAMWGAPQILDSNDCGYCHSCTGQSTVCHRKVGQLRLLYERHVVL